MRTLVLLLFPALVTAQLPDFYKSVARLTWIVQDADETAAAWRKIGVPVDESRVIEFRPSGPGSNSIRFRALVATGRFANLRVDWVQPVDAASTFALFLNRHGPGVFAVVYEVPSTDALAREIARLRSLGAGVLDQGSFQANGARKVAYAYMDTTTEGKYSLALFCPPAADPPPEATLRVTQFAFIANGPGKVSAFWQKFGFPPFSFTHPELGDKMFRGRPASFDMRLGWQRHTPVPFEWIQPLKGPTVYTVHLEKHGEGFHHLAFDVPDMDAANRRWISFGYPLSMSGSWGEPGKAGSGRFAYHDTHSIGGADIELLWNYRPPAPPPAPGPFVFKFPASAGVLEFRIPVSKLHWPSDWRAWHAIRFDFFAASLEPFSFGFSAGARVKGIIMEPLPGLHIRAVIPLDAFYQTRQMTPLLPLGYKAWPERLFTFERVEEIVIRVKQPAAPSMITLTDLALTSENISDEILDKTPVIDAFGQWIAEDWPEKAHSTSELRKLWAADKTPSADFSYCPLGGDKSRVVPLSSGTGKPGFFRVVRVDARWYLADPHGHPFFSTGMDLAGWKQRSFATSVTGREYLFEKLPPPGPAWLVPGKDISFHAANIMLRHGTAWEETWTGALLKRLKGWGFNTIGNWSDFNIATSAGMPYVLPLSGWSTRKTFPFPWDFPDVFSQEFANNVDAAARRQCAPLANDRNLIGWFIGNEPHWAREFGSLKSWADMLLEDPEPSATKAELQRLLVATPEKSDDIKSNWVYICARKYFETIAAAIRRHDPNHLLLGIRYAGAPDDEWVRMSSLFDVFSINIYDAGYRPDPAKLDRYRTLSGKPILIGEFTAGAPGRGLQGLFYWTHKVRDQTQRGIAYRYYVENAAAHPAVIGAHWFQLVDDLPTGRPSDLERLNYGFLNVLDLPYKPLVEYAREAYRRIYAVKSGRVPPYHRRPE